MPKKKIPKVLKSVAKAVRASVAGRRRSDQKLLRVLRSDSNEPTVCRALASAPDSKTPLCPLCGALMIHAKGRRSKRPEFWACSRLSCDGTREIAE